MGFPGRNAREWIGTGGRERYRRGGGQSGRRRILRAVGFSALSACLAGCTSEQPDRPKAVVLIVVDALRADRLPFYGFESNTAPFLSSLARRSVVFEKAWSGSSWTCPAMASIFTSLYPSQHGVLTNLVAYNMMKDQVRSLRLNRMPPAVETLAEVMHRLGYKTFGIVDNPTVAESQGFGRGFDRFVVLPYKAAEAVNEKLAEWSDQIKQADRYFLYLHYMDPHQPYNPRQPWFRKDSPEDSLPTEPETWSPDLKDRIIKRFYVEGAPSGEVDRFLVKLVTKARAAYDSEIGYVDKHIQEVFDLLSLENGALVIFTSDHGEEFCEHGSIGHDFQLYSELTRVPLLVFGPHLVPRRVAQGVTTLDIFPTLCELAGGEAAHQLQGASLRLLLAGQDLDQRKLFSMRALETGEEVQWKKAVMTDNYKYIVSHPSGVEELYDLARDPAERDNMATREAIMVKRLRDELRTFEQGAPQWNRSFADPTSVAPELIEQLRQLGYAGDR
ncbi:MAG: sulfatase [Planctomycetota bacterium]